jgi:hypothetical protein
MLALLKVGDGGNGGSKRVLLSSSLPGDVLKVTIA